MKNSLKRLIENRNYAISISDIDYIFREAFLIKDDKECIDYVFDNLQELPNDLIIGLWDNYLDYNLYPQEETLQTSSNTNIDSTIGKDKLYPYETELVEI